MFDRLPAFTTMCCWCCCRRSRRGSGGAGDGRRHTWPLTMFS